MNSSDSLETHHLRLLFKEAEIVCRLFAHKYDLKTEDVLTRGIGYILKENTDLKEHILPTEDDINALSLPELKQECRVRKLKISGNKAELKHRLISEVNRLNILLTKLDSKTGSVKV